MEIKDLKSNILLINKNKLNSYPIDFFVESDFSFTTGNYIITNIDYKKPLGNNKKSLISINLIDDDGEKFVINKKIFFSLSENDKVAESISPWSFNLRSSILAGSAPNELNPRDFISKFKGINILKVNYNKPPSNEAKTNASLTIRLEELNSIMKVVVPIEFKITENIYILNSLKKEDFEVKINFSDDNNLEIQEISYLGKHELEIVQKSISQKSYLDKFVNIQVEVKLKDNVSWFNFEVNHNISTDLIEFNNHLLSVHINDDLIMGCSPSRATTNLITYPKIIKLIKMKFIPPKSLTSKKAKVIATFSFKGKLSKKTLDFEFLKSVEEFSNDLVKKVTDKDIKFIPDVSKFPKESFSIEDFQLSNSHFAISDISYDESALNSETNIIDFHIHAMYRTLKLSWNKKIEYKFSKAEYLMSKELENSFDFNSIKLPSEIYDPFILSEINNLTSKEFPNKYTSLIYMPNGFPFKLERVLLLFFNIFSQKVSIDFVISQGVKGKTIERHIEMSFSLEETFAEKNLSKITEKDIEINRNNLTDYPPNELGEGFFNNNKLFDVLSTKYIKPIDSEKNANMIVQVGSGRKSIFLDKEIKYKFSKKEHEKYLWDLEDKKFLNSIDPSDINFHINIFGAPLEKISKESVSGIPDGIDFEVNYTLPNYGDKIANIEIILLKNRHKLSFNQKINFAIPRSKESRDLQETHTIQIPKLKKTRKL